MGKVSHSRTICRRWQFGLLVGEYDLLQSWLLSLAEFEEHVVSDAATWSFGYDNYQSFEMDLNSTNVEYFNFDLEILHACFSTIDWDYL